MTTTREIETQELAGLLQARSKEGFSLLYDNYSGALYSVTCKFVKDKVVAQDILQDIFVKIWRGIDKYNPTKGTLFTWMLNITRNTCIDYFRSRQYQVQQQVCCDMPGGEEDDDARLPVAAYTPENTELRKLAYRLDKKYREVIDLVYFEGWSQHEVSQILNIPLGTVKTRCREGVKKLRSIYNT